uniref:Peptidase A2 domain-containing protein n=1 Tax=Romanomermis culicivorax TaxID=13658 RepID=A0A915HI03_ROMCU
MIHLGSVMHSAAASYQCTFCVIHLNGKDCYTSSIVDSGAEVSLLLHSLCTKWIGVPLSKSNAQLFSYNNTEIAGLKGQFTATIEYNGRRAKVTLLALDMIKVVTWGTDTIEVLQLVIDGATQQINFVQPIDSMPPAAAVQLVQSMPAASHRYLSDIAHDFPKLRADGMGKFLDFEHCIMLMDDAIPVARPVRQVPMARHAAVEKEVE